MNSAINEIKNTLEGTNSRSTEAEDRISEVEDRMVKINKAEKKKEKKRMIRNEDNLRDLWDNVKCPNNRIIGVPEEEDKQKGHLKHSNLNKMKRQRNTQQVKEHNKCPPDQTKEEEIENLPEKEFRIMIVKMIQNLENKMELQINSLETRIENM